ncbi:MAG: glycerol kinase GlpK [Oscillospiraceae bacterium]|nr:glycerol kinase GlpK [Oscillospiraceae bacterium]
MKRYVMALDQGTTSSRAVIFDRRQRIVGICQQEYPQIYPQAGWVEHDPLEIWSSQYSVMTEVMAKYSVEPEELAAIGITNQRETTIVWDKKTGEPVYNAIVWQCRRTAPICEELRAQGLTDYIRENTGLLIDAYFSGTKLKWILDRVPGARERAERGELLFGTVDTWLVWKLTGGTVHVTDYTNASRTMLYNIRTLCWDEKILNALDIPRCMLPEVRDSSAVYGTAVLGGTAVPIAGIAGDQQAALFGQACFDRGDAKNTYGTGCFLLMNVGDQFVESRSGLLTTIAVGLGGKVQYALEGSVFVGGAVVQWLRDSLRLIENSAQSEQLALSVPDSGGVFVVPAFTGLAAPHWDMYARGIIVGLSRGSTREHIVRAALESIAYQVSDVVRAMERDTGVALNALRVDGGASANNFLMQFQADILGRETVRPVVRETTALGAACLAGLAVGFWSSREDIRGAWSEERRFAPGMDEETRTRSLHLWEKAVSRAKNWAED